MMKTGDKWNWAMFFSAIALTAAFLGARWCVMMLGHGPVIISGAAAIQFAFIAGLVCLAAAGAYAALTKRTACLIGLAIAAGAFIPLMFANSLAVYLVWFLFDLVGFKALPFNPYNMRMMVPTALLLGSFAWRPRDRKASQQRFPLLPRASAGQSEGEG